MTLPAMPAEAVTSALVTPGGGALTTPDGRVTLHFPPGAVTETVAVTATLLTSLPAPLPPAVWYQDYGLEVQMRTLTGGQAVAATLRPITITLNYTNLPNVGNAASQRLLALYNAAQETPERLLTQVSPAGGMLTATTTSLGIIALASAAQTPLGDYSRPWQPAVQAFQVDTFSGATTWRIPIKAPAGRSGVSPNLALAYNSGSVDELRGSANPQTPGVGQGWSLGLAYIERKIERDEAETPKVYLDGHDTFRLVLDGVSSKLVCVDASVSPCVEYRAEDERFWRIRKLVGGPNESRYSSYAPLAGEYWLATAPDGTSYRFGWSGDAALYPGENEGELSAWYMLGKQIAPDPNDPQHAKIVPYIWRWNLDRVEDTHGNVASLFYEREYNDAVICRGDAPDPYEDCWYAVKNLGQISGPGWFYWPDGGWWYPVNAAPFQGGYADRVISSRGYVRGGYLVWAAYTRGSAADVYDIRLGARELSGYYPDVLDSYQASGRYVWNVQTFWSKKVINTLTVTAQDQPMRTYTLSNELQDGHLLLNSVTETGADGADSLPPMRFDYLRLPGYCDKLTSNQQECEKKDGQPHEGGYKYWLGQVANGYGGTVSFNYTAPSDWDAPWQNGQTFDPTAYDGKWWYRYRIREATAAPVIGPVMRSVYEYRNAEGFDQGKWTGAGDEREFRGHPIVRVYERSERSDDGAGVTCREHYYYRGLAAPAQEVCGGSVTDREGLEGREYKQVQYALSADGYTPGPALAQQTQRWDVRDLGGGRRFVALAAACAYPAGASGPHSRTEYQYDDYGNVTREARYGDAARSGDEAITERQYLYNLDQWIVNKPSTESLLSGEGALQTQTRYAYDGQAWSNAPLKGDLTETASGAGTLWASTRTAYDEWGNPTVVTDTLGHATQMFYDERARQFPVLTLNALEQPTRVQWDVRLGVPVVITDANNAATHISYDGFGRAIAVTPPGESVPSVKYAYQTGDAITAPFAITTETRIDAYTTPTYQRSWTIYDGLGRAIQTQAEAENGWLVVQSTAYDARGLPVTATLPYTVAAMGGVYHPPDWNKPQTLTRYDALGRVERAIAPDGSVTQRAYRDWRELTLDANGHQTESEQDGLGRLVAVREYYGKYATPTFNATEIPAQTRYWYSARSNLVAVQDAQGNTTRMAYDALGRKTAMDDPSMGHWTYQYDLAGNLVEQISDSKFQISNEYDALNRLARKSDVGNQTVLAEYEYDVGMWGIGQRTAMTDTTGVTRWQYDAQGRTLAETRTIDGVSYTTGWEYDAAGRVVRMTYPNGEVVETTYNRRGLVTQLAGQDMYLTNATYNALGQPTLQTWGNTRATSYAYHPQNVRLTQLQVSGNLLDLRYGYDKIGNITAITDTVNSGQVQTFGYDPRDRLTWAKTNAVGNGQYDETYAYSLMGNILTRTLDGQEIAYTYGRRYGLTLPQPTLPITGAHLVYLPLVARNYDAGYLPQPFAVVATSAGFRAGYDSNGNMLVRVEISGTQRITYTQAWDAENRLSVVTNTVTGDVTRFYYDGDGNRVKKKDANGATVYIGAHFEKDVTTNVATSYYYAGSQRVAMRQGITVTYLHGDHLGSVSLATDAVGGLVSKMRYTPHGVTRSGDMPTDQRYTDQRWESGLGLYDYGARFYSPSLGRFLSADPIIPNPINPQLFNRYTYAGNNPILYNDPDGHCGFLCMGLAIAGVTAAIALVADMTSNSNCHAGSYYCATTAVGAKTGKDILSGQYQLTMRREAPAHGLDNGFEIVLPAAILRQGYPSYQRFLSVERWTLLPLQGWEDNSWGPAQITPAEARLAGGAGREELFSLDKSVYYMAFKLGMVNIRISEHPDVSPLDRFMLLSIGQNPRLEASSTWKVLDEFFTKYESNWSKYLSAYPGYGKQLWAMFARYEWLVYNEGWSLPPGVSLEEYQQILEGATGGRPY